MQFVVCNFLKQKECEGDYVSPDPILRYAGSVMKLTIILLLVCGPSHATGNNTVVNGIAMVNFSNSVQVSNGLVKEVKAGAFDKVEGEFGLNIVEEFRCLDNAQLIAYETTSGNWGNGYQCFEMDTVSWLNLILNYSNVWDVCQYTSWRSIFIGGVDHYANIKFCNSFRSKNSILPHKPE